MSTAPIPDRHSPEFLDLARRAAAGDSQAMMAFTAAVRPIITGICHHERPRDRDDAEQEALIAIWQRVLPRVAAGEVAGDLAGLIATAVRNRVRQFKRDAARLKRGGRAVHHDIDSQTLGIAASTPDPAAEVAGREAAETLLSRLNDAATPTGRRIIHLALKGYSLAGITGRLHLSPRAARNNLWHLARKVGLNIAPTPAVEQIAPGGGVVAMFANAADAERHTGISGKEISAVCRGKRKTAGGFGWRRGRAIFPPERCVCPTP